MAQKPLFSDLVAWFPTNAYTKTLKDVIGKHGGRIEAMLTPAVTHIIVCEPRVALAKLVEVLPEGRTLESYQIVKREFISESVLRRELQDPAAFRPFIESAAAPAAPPVSLAESEAFPPPPKRQKAEAVATPPPRPFSASRRDASAPPASDAMGADLVIDFEDSEGEEEEDPCVVERRGSEWVAVRGRLPCFTGGATGLPWGSYGVWEEPYDRKAAEKTKNKLHEFYFTNKTAPDADDDSEDSDEDCGDSAAARRAKRPSATNGVCLHAACSRLTVCIVDALQAAKDTYPSDKRNGYNTRPLQRVIRALEVDPTPLRWPEQVDEKFAGMWGVGDKTISKIKEVLEIGRVASKVDGVADNERLQALARLQRVWGAGPTGAEAWYARGCRDVPNVRRLAAEGVLKLSEMQRCGLDHFEDLEKRIPRAAVAATERLVRCAVFELVESKLSAPDPERTYCQAAGSYSRGAPDSGDIDVLIGLPPSAVAVHCGEFLKTLLGVLLHRGLLLNEMDPLGASKGRKHREEHATHAVWMGVCRPPGLGHVAQIDVKVYAHQHLPFAVNYFANGTEFCRATRHWANRAPGPREGAKALHPDANGFKVSDKEMVPRKRWWNNAAGKKEEVILGEPVPLATETALFERLGLWYRPLRFRKI